MIYLDYQATTPPAPEVLDAMAPWAGERFTNPHSPSRWGREADAAIEHARDAIERGLGLERGRLAFTGTATEAINWALKGTIEKAPKDRNRIVTVATEHAATLDTCEWLAGRGHDVVVLPVQSDGLVDLDVAREAIDERTAIVAVMLVNNEIGVIQPVSKIARMAKQAGALTLCDAVQGFGRIEIKDGPDLVAIAAHKIHGPKGIGALWMRKGAEPAELIHGGGQELGLRSGTLSPALCVGFGAAARLAGERATRDQDHVGKLAIAAREALGPEWTVNGSLECRYDGNLNVRRDGVDAARLIGDLREIAFSLGSACASGSGRPSHVLKAIGLNQHQVRSSIRLGFGRYTTKTELVEACKRIAEAAQQQERVGA
jgi:cysteine desulfurase